MSASVAGQFQDHYVLLGVDPSASIEVIQTAYAAMVRKYDENSETWDDAKLEKVHRAYETLSDPHLRREFDKLIGITGEEGNPKFSGAEFFKGFERHANLRFAVLCILYDRRQMKPQKPSISHRLLEAMLEITDEDLNFALWYVKQRNWVVADDKSSLQITVDGMDFLETNKPTFEMVAPFIKRDSIAVIPRDPNTRAPAEVGESVRKLLGSVGQARGPVPEKSTA